ncbi:hypothetical protein BGX29_011792 [Mortierella sp. GBA35]|nr:hypothetical protein BGX29_011792 [Mortierella sp. GBA35]
MVSFTVCSLILSASLATITTFSTAAPNNSHRTKNPDPCGILGKKNGLKVNYKDVADCYRAIPFDPANAATTISTVHDLFKDYYVFTDSALTRQVPKPFAREPVDILKQLKTIGRRKYTSDYQFHTDVRHAVDTLRDGHASYDVDKIDGQGGLTHIREWATKRVSCSHDINARQNCALARQAYDVAEASFLNEAGEFSYRSYLPEKKYIDYELRCDGKSPSSRPIRLREEWIVHPQSEIEFEDVESYVENVCLRGDDDSSASALQGRSRTPHLRNLAIPLKKRTLPDDATAVAAAVPPRPVQEFRNAERLVAGNATVFYHLKSEPNVGVMVVHTFDAEDAEVDTVLKGLKAFHKRNVTNILVDFQGNGGGLISLSSNLVQMLFPNKNPLDASFEADMRVTKSIQKVSKKGFKSEDGGNYNANDYIDLQANGTQYRNNDLFMKPVTIRRNGRKTLFSEKTALHFDPLSQKILDAVAKFPWTARRENIRILTDGRCGSACGMASYFWTTIHGVETYSIGGTKGEDLSMFSFAGASVITLSDLQENYSDLKLKSPLKDLAYKNEVRFSWLELYGKNRTTPLEYDPELYKPTHRLDYTPKNARSREGLWRQVAVASWK